MDPKDIRPELPHARPVPVPVPLAVVRERIIQRAARAVAAHFLTSEFATSDNLTAAFGKLPEGVDPRTPSLAFRRLAGLGLIRRIAVVDSPRRGGYAGLWRCLDRPGLIRWLAANPPTEGDTPIVMQMSFAFVV
jgi:hypothetical protein